MARISLISAQKRNAKRYSVHLDGKFAFGCNQNVVVKFNLKEGLDLSALQLDEILNGAVRQECFDAAMKFLERRLHSRNELLRKLVRQDYSAEMTKEVLADLERMAHLMENALLLGKSAANRPLGANEELLRPLVVALEHRVLRLQQLLHALLGDQWVGHCGGCAWWPSSRIENENEE